jgi:hypothetical protein
MSRRGFHAHGVVGAGWQHRGMTELFLGSEALAGKAMPERAMRSLYDAVQPGFYAPGDIELTERH